MSSSSSSNAIFTGSSQFSTDFQNVITRAVNIASLPLNQLQSQLTTQQSQQTALNGLDTQVTSLQSAVQGIQDAMGAASYTANVSDSSIATATVSSAAAEGTYTIDVVDAGAYSTSLTTSSWDSSPAVPHTYQLWVGDTSDPANEIDITPTDNTAQSVAAAINAKAGDKVKATAVNVGSSDTPDWRISLQSTTLGSGTVDIQDNGTSLQTVTAGREAQYIVNNSGVTATSTSRAITIANGLTVNLLKADSGNPVTVTVTQSSSALSNALSAFATAYNSTVDALAAQTGTNKGALAGDSIVRSLSGILSRISTYAVDGSQVGGLTDLGLELGSDGKLTFDSGTLAATVLNNPADLTAFLGSSSSGGFLENATDLLNGVEQTDSGLLKAAEAGIASQITTTNSQISNQQDYVDQLQTNLQNQMAAADAAIAAMEQQYTYLSNMWQAMDTAASQYK